MNNDTYQLILFVLTRIALCLIVLGPFGLLCHQLEQIIKRHSWKRRSLKAVKKILKERSALRVKKVADEYKSVSSGTA